jgi:hypothetical protein
MFTRYARNFAHGLGISWNLDGVHTYGLTSLPWMFFVLPATFFLASQAALQICSATAAGIALSAMTLAVRRNAAYSWLTNPFAASLAVILPLVANPVFQYHMRSGMDTFLSVAVNAIFVWFVLRWQSTPSGRTAIYVGLAAFCAAAVRLDSALCALFIPYLAWRVSSKPRDRNDLLAMCGMPALLLIGYLLTCQIYFGSALPLSFYAKSAHGYVGLLNGESPVRYFEFFLTISGLAGVLILTLANQDDLRHYGIFFVPSLVTLAYLLTVRQIMGGGGRFFLPQLPFFEVPGLLILDRFIGRTRKDNFGRSYQVALIPKIVTVALTIFALSAANRSLRALLQTPIAANIPHSTHSLPDIGWFDGIHSVASLVSHSMPGRGVIAATEVGYLGDQLPNVDIIDLAGLNNTRIGLKGLSMDDLLSQKPDLIWFPHTDYTGLRIRIFGDARLYQQYVVVLDAFNYGIAIRKASPYRTALERNVQAIWPNFYPGTSMEDYVVKQHPLTLVMPS